ncbi:MAG: glycosyltransferase, partial [Ignavibacteria bacterium]|nr:glycosyltransferase [Ignavibacteria bacterium]
NLILSAPGNSIIPNTGVPKYQMFEGLIHLGINVVASYLFIKYYGIIGAAYGNGIATLFSSLFIFATSLVFFRKNLKQVILNDYLYPLIVSIASGILFYMLLRILYNSGFIINSRVSGLALLVVLSVLFFALYSRLVLNSAYLNARNKTVLARIIAKIIPAKYKAGRHDGLKNYEGEKVSIFILTYNKVRALEKCLGALMPSIKGINYELIVYNNASTDGTKEFLERFASEYPDAVIYNSTVNRGNNAKSLAADMCAGEYIIGADDDVIEFPGGWVERMVSAYKSVSEMGYLVTDVVQDDKTNGAKFPEETYQDREYFGGAVTIQEGPAGGWCFM